MLPTAAFSISDTTWSLLRSPYLVSVPSQWNRMYDTRKSAERQKANILMRLCQVIFFNLIMYNDIKSNTLQAPFRNAFSLGNKYNNCGDTAGAGNILAPSIATTTNTNMETPATKRNISLSEKFMIGQSGALILRSSSAICTLISSFSRATSCRLVPS